MADKWSGLEFSGEAVKARQLASLLSAFVSVVDNDGALSDDDLIGLVNCAAKFSNDLRERLEDVWTNA